MTQISDVFTELFYGGGSWLMLIILVSMILVISVKIKYSLIIFIPISIFLGFNYLNKATPINHLDWCAVIMWILPIFLVLIELEKRRG